MQYESVKSELACLEQSQINGLIVRSKARWTEQGEKCSKYFFSLEKHNYELKHITSVCTDEGVEIDTPKGVLSELHSFYKQLYTPTNTTSEMDFTEFNAQSVLNQFDCKVLERDITITECKEALEELPTGKTPGTDGLPAEFYRKFWPELGELLFSSLNKSISEGELSIEQRRYYLVNT